MPKHISTTSRAAFVSSHLGLGINCILLFMLIRSTALGQSPDIEKKVISPHGEINQIDAIDKFDAVLGVLNEELKSATQETKVKEVLKKALTSLGGIRNELIASQSKSYLDERLKVSRELSLSQNNGRNKYTGKGFTRWSGDATHTESNPESTQWEFVDSAIEIVRSDSEHSVVPNGSTVSFKVKSNQTSRGYLTFMFHTVWKHPDSWCTQAARDEVDSVIKNW